MSNDKPTFVRDTIYSLKSANLPMGRLSEVKLGSLSFQIQTEAVLIPEAQVQTLVILNGAIKHKKVNPFDVSMERDTLAEIVNTQHQQTIDDLKQRIAETVKLKHNANNTE